jgi:ferredoxin
MLNSKLIKEKAKEFGADIVGIGDIKNFEGFSPQQDPKMILPEAKCIIGCGFRVPRALFQTMSSQSQFFNYTQLGVKYLDEEFSEIFLLKMAALIENEGYDACLQRNVSNLRIKGDKTTNPELIDTYELTYAEPVAKGKPAPDVIMDFGRSAEICGLGSVSVKGTVITPEFGPFTRFVFIVTDAPLESDCPFTENLCDKCGECANACPGNAIDMGTGMNTWQCAVYYRGAHRSNPLMKDGFLSDDPEREAILDGKKCFDADSARKLYPKLDFLPSRPTGYVACLCGKKCDMACYKHLKEKEII